MDISFESIVGSRSNEPTFLHDIADTFSNRRVFVTGAGGSIGSAIVEKLASLPNPQLLVTDRDENRLHSLSLKLQGRALFDDSRFRLLDVRDREGVNSMIQDFQPDFIIHAAALKHLAVLESQPREAYLTNVIGTNNVVCATQRVDRECVVLNISTDKAAAPMSILGKTKLITEGIVSKSREEGNLHTNVRFGNVFASRGSVIETFVEQMMRNSPVTLTHPDVKRFFMKIEEAALLSLQALAVNSGATHVLNMGEPILLSDIIKRLAKILDCKPQIVITGLRVGEKLEETLHAPHETLHSTSLPNVSSLELNRNFDLDSELLNTSPVNNEHALSLIETILN